MSEIADAAIEAKKTLSDAELAAHVPPCQYCGDPIPPDRAKNRLVKTCSDAHAKLYRQWRRWQRSTTRCKACLRPCTPEQREEFRAWRRAEKGLKARGRPPVARDRTLRAALDAAVKLLADQESSLLASEAAQSEEAARVLRMIAKAQKLLPEIPAGETVAVGESIAE